MSQLDFIASQPRLVVNARFIGIAVLFVFGTAFAPLVGDGQRNFLVIGLSMLMPLFLIAFSLPLRKDLVWSAAVFIYLVVVSLMLGTTSDVSSIAYTGLFLLSYLFFVGCLNKGIIARRAVIKFLRYLIYAFAVVSVVQISAALADLPIPNEILSKGTWNHNSLAVEPSHLGRLLCVSIFVYLVLRKVEYDKGLSPLRVLLIEWRVIFAFAVSIILSGSTLAVFAGPLAFVLVFNLRWMIFLLGLVVLSIPVAQSLEIETLQRGLSFFAALPTMDIWALAEADHSGSVRVMPALVYLNNAEPDTIAFWFGSGLSEIRYVFAGRVIGVSENFIGGFFPSFSIAFGVIGFALINIAFILRFLTPKTLSFIAFWYALFLATPWNTQLFWYALMMLRIVYHFEIETKIVTAKRSLGQT